MIPVGRKCLVVGCEKLVAANGVCQTHYMRQYRHGHLTNTRPEDWGSREKHELYATYRSITRSNGASKLCHEWQDFWQFVNDVGEKRKGHRFCRIDETKLYSKDNVYWSATKENKEHATYQRIWRSKNPEYGLAAGLKRYFGLTVDDYERMWNEQNGKCKICDKPETASSIDSRRTRRLAVDHCHASKKIRSLLCAQCNSGLGNFRDDPELLEKAAAYIRQHTG